MTGDSGPAQPFPAGRAGFWAATTVFAGVVVLGIGLGLAVRHGPGVPAAAVAAVVAIAACILLLLLQRRRPLLVYAAAGSAGIAVIAANQSANPVWFAVCLLAGWCALAGTPPTGFAYWAAAIVLFAAEWGWINPDPGWGAWLAGVTFTMLAGLLVRRQLDLVARLRAAQAGLAAAARSEERNRISRDLHDVIAHTLTVSLLHVMSARLAVEHSPGEAASALAEAERLSRESLAEVRQVVGMLRQDEGAAGVSVGDAPARASAAGETAVTAPMPLPGASELPALVSRFQSAGANVTLSVAGDPSQLPATVGLALYRILQEALTNVIKHAPGPPATARLNVCARQVTLTVDSLGPPGTGTGLGLVSMRERADLLGGHCEAGPSGAGWLVRATVPLTAAEGAV